MSGQKSLHFLRSTKYWSMLQKFLDDPVTDVLELPRSVTSAERDQVRQICKHLDLPFKVFGEGTEKYMVVRKPDFSYFAQVEQQSAAEQLAVMSAELEHWKSLAINLASEHSICSTCSEQQGSLMNKSCGHCLCESCAPTAEICGKCSARVADLISLPSKRVRREN